MSDLQVLFNAQESVRRWRAEHENAAARLELARSAEARAILLSGHEPVASLVGMRRDVLRVLLAYTVHCDESRMNRELNALHEDPRA